MVKETGKLALAAIAAMALSVSGCSRSEPPAPPAQQQETEREEAAQQQAQQQEQAAEEEQAAAEEEQAAADEGEENAATAEAAQIWSSRCVACHGASGEGDGAAAAALNPKPRSFTDKSWQSEVTDEHIETVILKGGPAVGQSPLMPGNPDLEDKPEVVSELRKIVRGFGE